MDSLRDFNSKSPKTDQECQTDVESKTDSRDEGTQTEPIAIDKPDTPDKLVLNFLDSRFIYTNLGRENLGSSQTDGIQAIAL